MASCGPRKCKRKSVKVKQYRRKGKGGKKGKLVKAYNRCKPLKGKNRRRACRR